MHFPTYRVSIRSRCRYQEKQRLFSRVARAVGHDIIQGTVRLRMEFVENNAVNIQSVLGITFCRQHLVEAVQRRIHKPLLRHHGLYPLFLKPGIVPPSDKQHQKRWRLAVGLPHSRTPLLPIHHRPPIGKVRSLRQVLTFPVSWGSPHRRYCIAYIRFLLPCQIYPARFFPATGAGQSSCHAMCLAVLVFYEEPVFRVHLLALKP